jgi:GMP synthase-like glutamine amidotransferase
MNIHIFQHVPFEGPGIIIDWSIANGHHLSTTPFYAHDYQLPEATAIDMLIIMGGPMGVYDEAIHPWLKEEKTFITSFLRENKPILGICLGAQLLAVCSGAAVQAAPRKEIGWFPVTPTAAAANAPWFYSLLEPHPVLFHWHGDRFGIPAGAVNLACTEANDNQAFLLNGKVLGLQFHAEVAREGLNRMVHEGLHELQQDRYIQSADVILNNPSFDIPHAIMGKVLDHLTAQSHAD